MADKDQIYIRPRRGTETTMHETAKAAMVLKEGELFFEFPDDGVGKGPAKVKIGDGTSAYAALPYALGNEAFYTNIDFLEETSTDTQGLIELFLELVLINLLLMLKE